MKTLDELVEIARSIRECSETLPESVERLQAIQLDAMKEGMRRAANLIDVQVPSAPVVRKQVILSAAEQLTEKNL